MKFHKFLVHTRATQMKNIRKIYRIFGTYLVNMIFQFLEKA